VVYLTVKGFEDLRRHVGHKIECVCYSDGKTVYGVSLECVTCGEVLVSFDNPEFVEECLGCQRVEACIRAKASPAQNRGITHV
jgi:ribosomal protein S27E